MPSSDNDHMAGPEPVPPSGRARPVGRHFTDRLLSFHARKPERPSCRQVLLSLRRNRHLVRLHPTGNSIVACEEM